MGRRARRRTRSDSDGRRHDVEAGFPTFEHNQWTFEGEIERLGAFARGAARAGGWKRRAALAVVAIFLLPFAIGVAVHLTHLH